MTQKLYYRDIWCLGTGTGYPGGSTMIPATLNPRLLALYGCEMPKCNEKKWMQSYHVRREIKKATGVSLHVPKQED